MSLRRVMLACLGLMLGLPVAAATVPSAFDVQQTAERYVKALQQAQVPVLERRPSAQGEEIIFINPLYGTRIGMCHKGLRKDKPLKVRIWRDQQGRVWLQSPDIPDQINQFGIIECGNEADQVRQVLDSFAHAATGF